VNLSLELLNALPDEQAQVEAAEQVLHRLQCLDLDAYQAEYLNAWQRFYTDHRHYLFPDDRAAPEDRLPRSEDVSALSYERTAHDVKQTRQDVLQSNKEQLDGVLSTATGSTTRRNKLAHKCNTTAALLAAYADVFADLTAATYIPCLPASGFRPERRVDEPATVGAALGLLDFLIYAYAEYKTSQLPTTVPPAATPNKPEQPLVATQPWADIEALAEKIGLRYRGRFTTASNKTAAAGAGLIDALREADIIPATTALPILYAEFSQHYGQKIRADRMSDTRHHWQKKARQALGLD
jgi:hypothetical protein